MTLDKVWDAPTERLKVGKGGVWPVEASCVMVGGEERWVLDELPVEISEQAYMLQWEQGVDGEDSKRQEWQCSGWRPGAQEEQLGTVEWTGSPWVQQGAEEGFAVGAEHQLLGEGHSSMRDDRKWPGKLAQARVDDAWGVLDVYSDGGADGAGTPAALQSMAGWWEALMRTHWRSGLKGQQGWVASLERWTPPELSCWRPMQCCIR